MSDAAKVREVPDPPFRIDERPIREIMKELPRFSPAAAMLAECAPSRLVLALPGVVLGVLALATLWAAWSPVDIVTTAPGRILPSARVKVVQPLEAGVVRRVLVREGDIVAAGAPVVDLDPTEATAERDRLRGELAAARAEVARHRALLAALAAPAAGAVYKAPEGVPAEVAERQRRLTEGQWRRLRTQVQVSEREQARLTAQIEANRALQAKLLATLAVLRERVAIRKELHGRELTPLAQLLELRQTLVEQEHEVAVQRANQRQIEADLASAEARAEQQAEEMRERLLGDLAEKERQADSLALELRKAEERAGRRTLAAPVAGRVVDLAVHTVGGVVREAEALMRIVPDDAELEVEASVKTRDIGFVRPDQAVEVKVDTFPYTRYGTVKGRLVAIPPDASGADPTNAVYKVRVALERRSMRVEGAEVALSPGMTVTVDIRTGERRVLDYLLEPVLKYRSEAMRER